MKAYQRLLNLQQCKLEVFRIKDSVAVAYANCEVKDGIVRKSVLGVGDTFELACEDYLEKISGQTLIFNDSKEIIVL